MRVISLSSKAHSIIAIVRQLQQEDIKIRRQTVAKILKQFRECGTLADQPAPGRKPIVSMQHLDFIDAKLEENDELTVVGKKKKFYFCRVSRAFALALSYIYVLFFRFAASTLERNGHSAFNRYH